MLRTDASVGWLAGLLVGWFGCNRFSGRLRRARLGEKHGSASITALAAKPPTDRPSCRNQATSQPANKRTIGKA
jgi:hypothetical protein